METFENIRQFFTPPAHLIAPWLVKREAYCVRGIFNQKLPKLTGFFPIVAFLEAKLFVESWAILGENSKARKRGIVARWKSVVCFF
jgi:hypothetical protein